MCQKRRKSYSRGGKCLYAELGKCGTWPSRETWPSSKTDMFNTAKYNSCLISTAADQIYIASALHGFQVVRISVFHWYFISLYEFILCSFVIVCYLGLPELLIILWTFLCVNMQNSFSRICLLNRHAST